MWTKDYLNRFANRRTPGEPRRVGYRGWVRIPATSRRNLANPDKIPTEPAKKYREILSKSGPGGSPEPPESVRDPSGTHPSEENAKKRFPAAKIPVLFFAGGGFGAILGPGREPKIDKKRARERKSTSGGAAGRDFCRFFSPVPFGVALQIDFWKVRPFKIVLFPRREHDFDKITVFEKTPKK